MKYIDCTACDGTGYISASRHQMDLPNMLKTIGLCICWVCNGSGKVPDMETVFEEFLRTMSPEDLEIWVKLEAVTKDWLEEKSNSYVPPKKVNRNSDIG